MNVRWADGMGDGWMDGLIHDHCCKYEVHIVDFGEMWRWQFEIKLWRNRYLLKYQPTDRGPGVMLVYLGTYPGTCTSR